MARERKNAPLTRAAGRHRGPLSPAGEGIRRRINAEPELELSPEELRALADEGIDPEELRRAARDVPEQIEASDHDRDTPRDQLEGLVIEAEDDR